MSMDPSRYKFNLEKELAQLKVFRAYVLNSIFWGSIGYVMYLAINVGSAITESGVSFHQEVSSASDERKTYMACVVILRTINPSSQDFHSCDSFKTLDGIKKRTIATVDPVDGECPVNFKLSTNFGVPVCKAVAKNEN